MAKDRELQREVVTALDGEPDIDVGHIGVTANNGVVTLDGFVEASQQRSIAEETARRVPGVRAIVNDLRISSGPTLPRTDTALAEAVVKVLTSHGALFADAVQATVEQGHVTLTGEVTWPFQRAAAGRAVQVLNGVKSVNNRIVVRDYASVADLRSRIAQAFQIGACLDAATVRVEVRGRAVTLRGSVRSQSARDEAERAVWSAPGVTKVDDRLVVEPQQRP